MILSTKEINELKNQIKGILKKIESLDERLKKIETIKPTVTYYEEQLTPALIRLLKTISEKDMPWTTEELANALAISRNVVSSYLNRLENYGYIKRTPNLDDKHSARYLFQLNFEQLPQDIKDLLKR